MHTLYLLVVCVLALVIMIILMCCSVNSINTTPQFPQEHTVTIPYNWNTHDSHDEYITIDPPDGRFHRVCLGPQYMSQPETTTGWTGASEYYLMPMDGIFNHWKINFRARFADVPTGSFPIGAYIRILVQNSETLATTEYTLTPSHVVYQPSDVMEIIHTVLYPVTFHEDDLVTVILDIELAEIDPFNPIFIYVDRVIVSALASFHQPISSVST